MYETGALEQFVQGASVEASVFAMRPDYRAVLVAVDGIASGVSDEYSETLLRAAEASAQQALAACPLQDIPHVTAWRDAYRSFGAKPQRTRNTAWRPCCAGPEPACHGSTG